MHSYKESSQAPNLSDRSWGGNATFKQWTCQWVSYRDNSILYEVSTDCCFVDLFLIKLFTKIFFHNRESQGTRESIGSLNTEGQKAFPWERLTAFGNWTSFGISDWRWLALFLYWIWNPESFHGWRPTTKYQMWKHTVVFWRVPVLINQFVDLKKNCFLKAS